MTLTHIDHKSSIRQRVFAELRKVDFAFTHHTLQSTLGHGSLRFNDKSWDRERVGQEKRRGPMGCAPWNKQEKRRDPEGRALL